MHTRKAPATRLFLRIAPLLLILGSTALAAEAVEGTCDPRHTLKPLTDPDPATNKLLDPYNLSPTPFPWRLETKQKADRFRVYHLTFPSPVPSDVPENRTVHAEYYLPEREVKGQPTVLVLHILDGRFLVARTICRYFAGSGTPALMVMMPFYGPRRPRDLSLASVFLDDPLRIFNSMRATVIECRRAASWLQERPEADPDRIGVVGVSLGAIAGGLLVGVDPRFKRNVLVLGGGDPAAILWHAPETAAVRAELVEQGHTLQEVRRKTAAIDAIHFARRVDRETVFFINARYDKTVPRDCTVRLWEAMGKPRILWLPAGHYSASLYIPVILPQAHHFVRHGTPLPSTAP